MTLSVFAQMIGEGIAIATLPLHLTRLGAKPVEVALATSFFSVAQMVCCPLLVRRSGGAGGRGQTLCLCLAGATLGNVGIAMSPSVAAIVVCRFLCGAFAASVPVAQAAATELVAPAQAPAPVPPPRGRARYETARPRASGRPASARSSPSRRTRAAPA